MPFLQLDVSHIAGSHLSRPIGESSKIVPTLAENFCLGCGVLHFHTLAFSRNVTLSDPQRGQRTPLGQRISLKNSKAFLGLLKYVTASNKVSGAFMRPIYTYETVCQVYYYRSSAWLDDLGYAKSIRRRLT